jgi:hypothetical protein
MQVGQASVAPGVLAAAPAASPTSVDTLWQRYVQEGVQAAAAAIATEGSGASLLAFAQFCWWQEGVKASELVLLQLLALARACPWPAAEVVLRHHGQWDRP